MKATVGKMSSSHKDFVIHHLEQIYLLSKLLASNLTKQIRKSQHHPGINDWLKGQHQQTEKQISLIEGCLMRLGGGTSDQKDWFKEEMGSIQRFVKEEQDELIHDLVLDFTYKQMQKKSCEVIISAALHLGDQETVSICQDMIQDEEKYLQELEVLLPMAVQEMLHSKYGSSET